MKEYIRLYTRNGRAKKVLIKKTDIFRLEECKLDGYYKIYYTIRGLARPWYMFWIELTSRSYVLKKDLED